MYLYELCCCNSFIFYVFIFNNNHRINIILMFFGYLLFSLLFPPSSHLRLIHLTISHCPLPHLNANDAGEYQTILDKCLLLRSVDFCH